LQPFSVLTNDRLSFGLLGLSLSLAGRIFGRPEATRTLLVHLSPGGDAVDCQEEQAPGAHHTHQRLQVVEDALENFCLRDAVVMVIVRVRTVVDDAVHVQVQVVKLRDLTKSILKLDSFYWAWIYFYS